MGTTSQFSYATGIGTTVAGVATDFTIQGMDQYNHTMINGGTSFLATLGSTGSPIAITVRINTYRVLILPRTMAMVHTQQCLKLRWQRPLGSRYCLMG